MTHGEDLIEDAEDNHQGGHHKDEEFFKDKLSDNQNSEKQSEVQEEVSWKQLNNNEWDTFCNTKLKPYEIKWTKKLEDYKQEDRDLTETNNQSDNLYYEVSDSRRHDDSDTQDDNQGASEDSSQQQQQLQQKRLMAQQMRARNKSMTSQELEALEKQEGNESPKKSKDDWHVNGAISEDLYQDY